MTEMCKSNPCCGNYRNCKEPPQFKQREGWDAYKARTASPAETQGGDGVREAVLAKAQAQVEYWNNRQRSEKALEDATTAESERDELLREKERLEAVLRKKDEALKPFAVAFDNAVISGRPPFEFVGANDFEDARAALAPAVESAQVKEDRSDG